jgi:RNA recognition motif-containing protein
VFIEKIPKDINSEALDLYFSKYGEIISCKVSLNEDYSSRG